MTLAEFVFIAAAIFFDGFGSGSNRPDITNVSTVMIVLGFAANLAQGEYSKIASVPPTLFILSAAVAAILLLADVGLGYYIGKRWFRRMP